MFYSVSIPVAVWIFDMDQSSEGERDRTGETLFIDARELGKMTDRTHREFTREDIDKIAGVYHAYNGTSDEIYKDVLGFCKAVQLKEIEAYDYVLTPGRYVGLAHQEQMSDEDYDVEMNKISADLQDQFKQGNILQQRILKNLRGIGYGK